MQTQRLPSRRRSPSFLRFAEFPLIVVNFRFAARRENFETTWNKGLPVSESLERILNYGNACLTLQRARVSYTKVNTGEPSCEI